MVALLCISAALLALGYLIYLRLHPRPLPGIPYHLASAQRISGDKPDILASFRELGEFSPHRNASCRKLGFPLIQYFFSPVLPPGLWLDDPREVEDILLRRNKEFDRSTTTSIIIGTIMPHSSIVKMTTPAWRAQRKMWAKAAKVDEEEVDISHDFDTAALDAIWVAILGEKLGGLRDQTSIFQGIGRTQAKHEKNEKASGLDMSNALKFLNQVALGWRTFKFPSLQLWLLKRGAEYRKFDGIKNQQIERIIRSSINKFQGAIESGVETPDSCAMDLVLRREVQAAHKAGIPLPDLAKDTELRDELFLLLWAGHDTTSNTLLWWMKYMSRSQKAQSNLRAALREAFPGHELPTVNEILESDIPYLDGSIEEALRLAATALTARRATVDTEILGCKIPKGTNVVFNSTVHHRPVPVPEEIRSATSRTAYEKRGRPGLDGPAGDDLQDFVPERWLIRGEDGKLTLDAYAIPRLAFGDGPRGCFGRKLAMHELRIMITLTMLSFSILSLSNLPKDHDNMLAWETMFRKPRECYAKFVLL
ncbi:cytochrome P450 [Pseudomassariella vexata]|uniref:Cytochrome P450 n=1 Tax=Pseudomassariella vexata TaxID=1141098 RepID=A0A1Y2E6Z9_9PEZI|nr:cytochrome P450 [Pseudomassariella vexata]ORY67353.1 cytochrome P450 [Pseudomassariella vexata]